jgi:transketolase
LGVEEVRLTKRALGWPEDKVFHIPEEALAQFRKAVEQGRELETQWKRRVDALGAVDPKTAATFRQVLAGEVPKGWEAELPRFTPADGAMATRDAGQKAITALADVLPNLIGGSGDLDPSTRTALKGHGDFESPLFKPSEGTPPTQGLAGGLTGYAGRNIHFGIREHAMAGIAAGMALHGGVLPFAATFFTFSDYMRPSIRLAALSKAHVIYVWTHDSIGLGEDGPTHQPVEQLASLRALPDLTLLRPADANETVEAWKIAVAHTSGPVGLVLTRQRLPILDRSTLAPASGVAKGAYVLSDCATGSPTVILIATGSEKGRIQNGLRCRFSRVLPHLAARPCFRFGPPYSAARRRQGAVRQASQSRAVALGSSGSTSIGFRRPHQARPCMPRARCGGKYYKTDSHTHAYARDAHAD